MQREAVSDPTALAAALRARFQPVTASRVAREQLDRLQQGTRSVNEYIADFQRLRTQLPSMAEEDALYAFERGLRRELTEKLRVQGVTTVSDAIALAARVGGIMQASTGSRPTVSVAQMEMDHENSSSMEQRITQAVLNAMQSHPRTDTGVPGPGAGMGAKTQTQRGYQKRQNLRAGPRAGQGRMPMQPPQIPGIPDELVQQRWSDQLCLRCGSADHRAMACPNGISARPSSSSSAMGN